MIIDWHRHDWRQQDQLPDLFDVIDLSCINFDPPLRGVFYADSNRSIVRCYDRDERGNPYTRSRITKVRVARHADNGLVLLVDGSLVDGQDIEIAWSEHRIPIRIEIKPDLTPEQRQLAEAFVGRSRPYEWYAPATPSLF